MNALSKLSISDLTVEERLELIEALWNSLDDEDGVLPDWHKAELDRRLATIEQDKTDAVPWETFREDLKKKNGF